MRRCSLLSTASFPSRTGSDRVATTKQDGSVSTEDEISSWKYEVFIDQMGLSLKTARMLVKASADHHLVAKAVAGGATEEQLRKIFK
jgi:hypothetical protein